MAENVRQKRCDVGGLEEELAWVKRQLTMTLNRSAELTERVIDAESAKRRFVSRMSVHVSKPLNAILQGSELLAREALTSEQQGQVEAIRCNAEQLLDFLVTHMANAIDSDGNIPIAPDVTVPVLSESG